MAFLERLALLEVLCRRPFGPAVSPSDCGTFRNHSVRIAVDMRVVLRMAVVCIMAAVFLAGCSQKYEHQRMDDDSDPANQIRAMIEELRRGGADELDEIISAQKVPTLSNTRQASLRAILAQIAGADTVELTRLDRFGRNAYRSALKLTTRGQTRRISLLLVADSGRLRWAGKN